ncbi:ferritin-like domain-containing protein [Arthrobacter sp. UYEF20]|uniref:ferritin-like domain-containing protein n=1 Tax=Arthrobacter sp. UYEF20 TaxID=1756363 RepID=UPI0033940CDA
MKDDTREKRWRGLTPRFLPRSLPRWALLACIAVVVVSLGVALIPRSPKAPGEPPFSVRARAAALSETLRLRAAGEQLGNSASGAGQSSLSRTVTLLTSQARALLAPGQSALITPSVQSTRSSQSTPSPTGDPSSAAAPLPDTAAGLAAALAGSGSERIADAAVADGGMARLLAAVGTAQLLQASSLAAASGAPAPPQADPAPPQLTGACPSPSAPASASPARTSAADGGPVIEATIQAALEAAVRTELQSIYGYQLALTRLGGDAAKSAAEQLARHEALVSGAESLSRSHCVSPPPREAGYALAPSFLASPAAGLAGLETAALPVYADLVALSEGETRQWALSAFVGAARRAVLWGAEPGPVPGLAADPDAFPTLPELPPSSSPVRSQAG